MLICHCAAVNDTCVRAAIAAGSVSIAEVTATCGAGGGCGGCHQLIQGLLDQATNSSLPGHERNHGAVSQQPSTQKSNRHSVHV